MWDTKKYLGGDLLAKKSKKAKGLLAAPGQGKKGGPGAATDPNWSNVVLLLQGDVVADVSPQKATATVTLGGNATISGAQKKWGTSSILTGTTGFITVTNTAKATAWAFGTGDFTIEFWWKGAAGNSNDQFFWFDQSVGGSPRFYGESSSGSYGMQCWANIALCNPQSSSRASDSAAFVHYAFVRASGVSNVYRNGVQGDTANVADTNNMTVQGAGGMTFGYYQPNGNQFANKYMNDIRVTKGVARYTSAFTPPTAQFPTS
jgi:hypothetical protein